MILDTQHEAKAVGNYYYNGMEDHNASAAYHKAKKVDNSQIVIKRYNYAHKNKYKAVGRVSNMDGWKGPGKDSMGTGFMVGNHTFVTNAHVVDKKNGQRTSPSKIKFQLNRDGKRYPINFMLKRYIKSLHTIWFVVETKENMAQKANVQPLKLATNQKLRV